MGGWGDGWNAANGVDAGGGYDMRAIQSLDGKWWYGSGLWKRGRSVIITAR